MPANIFQGLTWSTVGVALLVFGLAPGIVLRLILLIYPRAHPRRRELLAELYAVPMIVRPFWVAQQLEVAFFEGVPDRLGGPPPNVGSGQGPCPRNCCDRSAAWAYCLSAELGSTGIGAQPSLHLAGDRHARGNVRRGNGGHETVSRAAPLADWRVRCGVSRAALAAHGVHSHGGRRLNPRGSLAGDLAGHHIRGFGVLRCSGTGPHPARTST